MEVIIGYFSCRDFWFAEVFFFCGNLEQANGLSFWKMFLQWRGHQLFPEMLPLKSNLKSQALNNNLEIRIPRLGLEKLKIQCTGDVKTLDFFTHKFSILFVSIQNFWNSNYFCNFFATRDSMIDPIRQALKNFSKPPTFRSEADFLLFTITMKAQVKPNLLFFYIKILYPRDNRKWKSSFWMRGWIRYGFGSPKMFKLDVSWTIRLRFHEGFNQI